MPRTPRPKPPGEWGELDDFIRNGLWSQKDLAAAASISESFLSELLAGKKTPQNWVIKRLAAALQVRPESLRPDYLLPADVPRQRPADIPDPDSAAVDTADALPA